MERNDIGRALARLKNGAHGDLTQRPTRRGLAALVWLI